ncbi:MAG: CHASE4 domain-containing protein [Caulobacterales bacterium]
MKRLSVKIIAALAVTFTALIAASVFILHAVVAPNADRLEAQMHERDVARVEATLAGQHRDMISRVLDYARWDDTYAFLAGRKPGYISDNFTGGWFDDYQIDFAAFLSDNGDVLWRRGRNSDSAHDSDTLIQKITADLRAAELAGIHGRSGIVWTQSGPVLYAASPSVRSNGRGAPHGLVIFARRLEATRLSAQTQLPLELKSPATLQSELRIFDKIVRGRDTATVVQNDELVTAFALRSVGGALQGVVLTKNPRNIARLGHEALWTAIMLTAGAICISSLLLWLLLRSIIVAPLARIERNMSEQGSSSSPIATSALEGEFANIAAAYNELLERLRQNEREKTAAEKSRELEVSASQTKAAFLANAMRELHAPLGAIIQHAQVLETKTGGHAGHDARHIQRTAHNALVLISDILDLEQVESRTLNITPHSFIVSDFIRSIEAEAKELAAANGNTVSVYFDPHCGEAFTDEDRLRQCLMNVISNACKFTVNGHITLLASRGMRISGDELRFEVRDTGVGMSAPKLMRLLQPFALVEDSPSRRFEGAGLGLTLTRKLLELLGGDITATSTPSEGSVFAIRTPATLPAPENGAKENAA